MRYSVIIPTRDRQALLARTLESVFAQTLQPAEIIVVDDGSSDGTVEFLASLGSRIRPVQQRHRGPGAARNAGAAAASGDYLVFLDSDDLWLPWSLSAFAEAVERYARPALVCGCFRQFADEDELADCRDVPVEGEAFADYLSVWPRQPIVGASMMAVRRDEFLRVGGFAEAPVNLEDHDLSLKLGTARGFVQLRQPITLGWRLHVSGVSREVEKSLAGCALLVATEKAGGYPGGSQRAQVRRGIIAGHARSVSLECLKAGQVGKAWQVYRDLLPWHVSLGRWKYIGAFPMYALAAALRARGPAHS
jgi:hypothetical protein